MIKNLLSTTDLNTENYKLIYSKNESFQDFPQDENYATISFKKNTPTQSLTENDCSFITNYLLNIL